MAYASWSVVFGEQPSAAKWNILGTNDAYFDSIVGSGTAWSSWTPTLSGRFDDAKWTKVCAYTQVGKTVICRFKITASTTTPMSGGSAGALFTLPVTAVSYAGGDINYNIGSCGIYDSGTTNFMGEFYMASTTTVQIRVYRVDAAYASNEVIISTVPMTWTTNDQIAGTFTYEAA